MSVVKSLEANEQLNTALHKEDVFSLTPFGLDIISKGSPEFLFYSALPENSKISKEDLMAILGKDLFQTGMNQCMRLRLCKLDKNGGLFFEKNAENQLQSDLLKKQLVEFVKRPNDITVFSKNPSELQKIVATLQRRKILSKSVRSSFEVTKGKSFGDNRVKKPMLTPEMIKSGSWRETKFKKYNFEAKGLTLESGCLHPLLKVREEFREVLLAMGFEEMDTSKYVESSFWNFDALFQPQQHPARDAHDTFFLKTPSGSLEKVDKDYVDRVKAMHEHGGDIESIGWRYKWSKSEAEKNLLRTHTTAVSSRVLYSLAQKKEFAPMKRFSIDRVFRNESIDATHLAEFHQIEGFVVDYDLTLGDLMGVVSEFFKRVGILDIKFKPAYNPYTEPSMEIFGYSGELGKWIEVGNSGMFRPEMLRAMGFDERVSVIAWGLSLERPTMIKYQIGNIRELFGHKVDLNVIRKNPEVML